MESELDVADQKRWFKVWTGVVLVEYDTVDDETLGKWTRMGARIALAGEHGSVVFQDMTHLATFMRVPVELVPVHVSRMPNVVLTESETRNGPVTVTMANWRKEQEDSTAADRQKTLRDKRRGEEKRKEETPPLQSPLVWDGVSDEDRKWLEERPEPYRRQWCDPPWWSALREAYPKLDLRQQAAKYIANELKKQTHRRHRDHRQAFTNWLSTSERWRERDEQRGDIRAEHRAGGRGSGPSMLDMR